jgi:hypothetical protein
MLVTVPAMGQRIIAEVSIDAQNLDDAQRQATAYLDRDIKYYIENTQWVTRDLPADFVIQGTIFLDSYTESGYQRIYTAKAFWGNGDDQKYFDNSWQFAYNEGEQLLYTTSFQSLASFIDYWVFIILAGNLDTWTEFGGSQQYNRAQEIARLGSDSSLSKGWKERLEDVEYLSGDQNYRRLKFQYYESIYAWDNGNPERAQDLLDRFMENLRASLRRQNSRIFTQNFLKAKHVELAEFIWEVERRDIIEELINLDEDHRQVYQDILQDW